MTIKKYLGKTREEALEAARDDLGDSMVVMNVKEIRPGGVFGFIRRPSFEVTAAIEDDSPAPSYMEALATSAENAPLEESVPQQNDQPGSTSRRFDAVADGDIRVPPIPHEDEAGNPIPEEFSASASAEEEDLRAAFREVGEVVRQANAAIESRDSREKGIQKRSAQKRPVSSTYDRHASYVSYNDPMRSYDYTDAGRSKKPNSRSNIERFSDIRRTSERDERPSEATELAAMDESIKDIEAERIRQEKNRANESTNEIIKAIYRVLLEHEVDERYINQIMADLDFDALASASIETALGLVYQKLLVKYGRPSEIRQTDRKPNIIFFIGPTGVGKTTTIAKLASQYKIKHASKVALFTADTYRIAATQQLEEYANILSTPVEIIFEDDDINERLEQYLRYDLIFVDTTGFSHKSDENRENLSRLLASVDDKFEKQVFLVLSATTKYSDLKDIVDLYGEFTDYDLLFTKLDETSNHGNILNTKLYTGACLSYITAGQTVPTDIEVIDAMHMVTDLLGGGF